MISVIMLTYNREGLISRAIDSILAQTYPGFELLIVDNGSTDRSGVIADGYADRDSRVRVIHRERGNIGAGRNTGLDAAQGGYITFIDDDDWVEPDFLAFLLGLIQEHDADVAICGAADKAFNEKKLMTAEEALIELMWREKYSTGFPMKLFRAELFRNMRFSETDQFDDIGLIYRLFTLSRAIAYHGRPKYHVFRHPGNNSAWTTDHSLLTPETLEEYLSAYRARTEWLCERFPGSTPTWQYFEWSFMISMVEKIQRLNLSGCGEHFEKMKRQLREHQGEFLGSPNILPFEKNWMKQYCL